jgi:hypothetical protein
MSEGGKNSLKIVCGSGVAYYFWGPLEERGLRQDGFKEGEKD